MTLEDVAKERLLEQVDEIVSNHNGAITRDKAFEIWVAENVLGLDTQDAIESTEVGGPNDCGCDFYHYDDSERIISFGQAKWADNFDHSIDSNEIKKYFLDTIDNLETCPPTANSTFERHSVEFNDVKDSSKIRIYHVVTGELTQSGHDKFNDSEFRQMHKGENEWNLLTLQDILSHIVVDTTTPLTIKFEGKPLEKIDNTTNKKTLLGFVKGQEIVRVCTNPEFKNSIFLENPRRSLNRTTVNKEILSTLDNVDEKKIFYKLNNGITACCNKITEISDLTFEYQVDNFKIVNGRQSTFALGKKPGSVDNTVSIELKIHEIENDDEMRLISKSTNSQNRISASDLAHGTDELRTLNLRFESYDRPWKFELQRGNWNELSSVEKQRISKWRKIEKETMARTYLGYNNQSALGIKLNEKQIFENELVGGVNHFERIFHDKNPQDFIVPHIFFTMLLELEKSWKNQPTRNDDNDLLHQKVVKFHVLSFIKNSLDSTANKDQIITHIINLFENLTNTDPLPAEFIEIAEKAFLSFRASWHMYAPTVQLEPMNFSDARKHLIATTGALQELLNFKTTVQQLYGTDAILTSLNNLINPAQTTP